jgi:anti-anti-sigma regulatory factor
MMLKITKVQESRSDVLLKLEGKITAEWAVLLDGECRVHLREEKAVYLDCAGVDFIDDRGVDVLSNLPRARVTLMNAPGYVTELLETEGEA